jgi:hypothetical protein
VKAKSKLDKNNVSLSGEFAVLSQLAIRGYVANMTLGHTKGVDILVAEPNSDRMLKLEVKTNYRSTRSGGSKSREWGHFVSGWMMSEKHERMKDARLFYCFVNINEDKKSFRFFIVPSAIVADYVERQHKYWLANAAKRMDNPLRQFRLGRDGEEYAIPTPTIEQYEDNWDFKA